MHNEKNGSGRSGYSVPRRCNICIRRLARCSRLSFRATQLSRNSDRKRRIATPIAYFNFPGAMPGCRTASLSMRIEAAPFPGSWASKHMKSSFCSKETGVRLIKTDSTVLWLGILRRKQKFLVSRSGLLISNSSVKNRTSRVADPILRHWHVRFARSVRLDQRAAGQVVPSCFTKSFRDRY